MKNIFNKLHMTCLSAFVALSLMFSMSATVNAVDVINGNACIAANLNQAFELQWDHARVINPASNPNNRFVTCTLSTGPKYLDHTDILEFTQVEAGSVTAVFLAGAAADSEVSCIFRETDVDDAGIGAPDFKVVTIPAPASLPGTDFDSFLTADGLDIGLGSTLTVTCNLAPGTGINGISATHNYPFS